MSYTTPSLFTTLPSPTICGLQASTTHFSEPLKNAMPQISPNLHSIGGKQKKTTAQQVRIFTCFRTTPTRSDPQAAIMHSTGGPSATRFFTRFRRTPTRSDPAAAIMHSTRGPSVRLRCAACDETSIRAGPFGVRPGAPPLSVSIWRLGEGAFFPRAFRSTLEVPFFFCPAIWKRSHHSKQWRDRSG